MTEARRFDVIKRRRYTLIAERDGDSADSYRTARWFRDEQTGTYYTAESWKRPNFLHPLNDEQVAFVESVIS